MKNIISYSLWGNNPIYTHGAIHNANLVTTEFPGWIMRIYYNNTVPFDIIKILKNAENVELVHIDNNHTWEGLFWRFYVQDDKTVDRYIIRDLDCRLSKNDKACVDEWIESNKPIHLMRTCNSHNIEIMGGLWGAIRNQLNINMIESIKIFNDNAPTTQKGPDQSFLRTIVWPLIKGNCLVHGLDFHYNSGEVKDFIYGINSRHDFNGVPLPGPAGCVFPAEIKTWESGCEQDIRIPKFDVIEWYSDVRK